MKLIVKTINITLIVLTFFLSGTAILGGIALMANFYTPPVDFLQGSIFRDFTIPGLTLSLVVGGSAIFAAILLVRKNPYATLFATTAGIIIIFFEFVEVMVIGSPAGPAHFMQIFYFGLGIVIVIASMGKLFLTIKDQ